MISFARSHRAVLRTFRAAAVALALSARTAPAGAAPTRSYSLTLAPNAACPNDALIVARVAAREPGAERVALGGDVVGTVSMARDGTRIRAVVTVTRADGSVERPVSGSSCEDAADAVAFILALALDAETATTLEAPAGASGAAQTAGAEVEGALAAAVVPAAPVVSVATPPAAPARPPASRERLRWGGGVLFGVSGGVAPALALTEGLFFEGALRARSLTQSFRLTGLHAGQTATTPVGNAELDLFALRLHACPVGFGRAFFVEGCASFDVGRLRGRGYDAVAAKSDSATWYGPGALGRAGAVVGGWIDVGAEVGFVVPLARDRFYFLPDVTAHTIPSVAGYGLVFVGLCP